MPMASVTERLSQVGLPPNVMPEILFREGSLTDEQRQAILDSIDELTDFDNVLSINEEHPVVCSYISFVVAFTDGFPGEAEWKQNFSGHLATMGRILMEKTHYELTPMQKGFIINTAFRYLCQMTRIHSRGPQQPYESVKDTLENTLPALEAALEREFLTHLNETDPLGMEMFFEAIFYEIEQLTYTPESVLELEDIRSPFVIHAFTKVMSSFGSIVNTHAQLQHERNIFNEHYKLITRLNIMKIGFFIQFKDFLKDMFAERFLEEAGKLHHDILLSSNQAIRRAQSGSIDASSSDYVENICSHVYFVRHGMVEFLGDIGAAPNREDEIWQKYLSEFDNSRHLLNQNPEGGEEITRIGGGIFSLSEYLEIVRTSFQKWLTGSYYPSD